MIKIWKLCHKWIISLDSTRRVICFLGNDLLHSFCRWDCLFVSARGQKKTNNSTLRLYENLKATFHRKKAKLVRVSHTDDVSIKTCSLHNLFSSDSSEHILIRVLTFCWSFIISSSMSSKYCRMQKVIVIMFCIQIRLSGPTQQNSNLELTCSPFSH